MKVRKLIFFLFITLAKGFTFFGQVSYTVELTGQERIKHLPKSISIDTSISFFLNKNLRALSYQLLEKGFFLHTIKEDTALRKVSVDLGIAFDEIAIRNKSAIEIGVFKKNNTISSYTPNGLRAMIEGKMLAYANGGYPFVNISLDSVQLKAARISARLKIDLGRYSTLKAVHIRGDSSISERTAQGIIDYAIGEVYSERKIGVIDRKIQQTSFLTSVKPSEILYTDQGFELFLYLKSTKVSYLRGAVGLQPNPVSQKMALTGEVNLKLENALKKGELFKFNWRSIRPQTQRMNFDINYPYLFQSPFGVESHFLLYKRDSTFLDLNSEINISYTLKSGFRIRAHYRFVSSSVLSGASSSSEFTSLNSFRTNAYGLSIERKSLNNLVNPSKGRHLNAKIYIGQRGLRADSINGSSDKNTTYSGHLLYREFIPIFQRHVLLLSAVFDFYSSPVIYQNELFRFGGLNTLRGFNEEELFASTMGQLTVEYRFLLDRNSNVFLFYDQGIYENTAIVYYNDRPLGFGAGISFSSKIGIFSITYALGKEFANPIDFRSSKIHFGYTAYF